MVLVLVADIGRHGERVWDFVLLRSTEGAVSRGHHGISEWTGETAEPHEPGVGREEGGTSWYKEMRHEKKKENPHRAHTWTDFNVCVQAKIAKLSVNSWNSCKQVEVLSLHMHHSHHHNVLFFSPRNQNMAQISFFDGIFHLSLFFPSLPASIKAGGQAVALHPTGPHPECSVQTGPLLPSLVLPFSTGEQPGL